MSNEATPDRDDSLPSEVRAGLARQRRTQADLAEQLGISRNAVTKRLSGAVPFTHREVARVAAFLGVSVSSLYGERVS